MIELICKIANDPQHTIEWKIVAEKLAEHFESINKLSEATQEEIVSVHEMGERIAQSVWTFFRNNANSEIVKQLQEAGLRTEVEKQQSTSSVLEVSLT